MILTATYQFEYFTKKMTSIYSKVREKVSSYFIQKFKVRFYNFI